MIVPLGSEIFVDTNVILYAVTNHPIYGSWCEEILDRIKNREFKGKISVIVLNELIHKLIIGEISQIKGIKPSQAVRYIKKDPKILKSLKAHEVVREVEQDYNLTIVGISEADFSLARKLMIEHQLLSNDALHLAVMNNQGIVTIATADPDFDGIDSIKVLKPEALL